MTLLPCHQRVPDAYRDDGSIVPEEKQTDASHMMQILIGAQARGVEIISHVVASDRPGRPRDGLTPTFCLRLTCF